MNIAARDAELNLQHLRHRPLPDLTQARSLREGYRGHPLDLNHRLSSETLVDVREFGLEGLNHYYDPDNPPYRCRVTGATPELLVRMSLGEKLQQVDRTLRARGYKLYLHDAYRPR